MKADDGNDASLPNSQTSVSGSQRCVTCVGLISRDGPLLTFPGALVSHGRNNQFVGGNVMGLLTRGEQGKFCSWI